MSQQKHKASESGDLFERRWVRMLLFVLIPVAVFILVSAGIRVSQYGIDHTIVILGQDRLVSGSNGVFRITLIDDHHGFLLPDRFCGVLLRDNKRYLLFDGKVPRTGLAIARNFTVPLLSGGPAEVEFAVVFKDKHRIIRKSVEIVNIPPGDQLVVPSDTQLDQVPIKVRLGDKVVSAYPEDRGAPAGLDSVLFVRVVEKNTVPIETDLKIKLPLFTKGVDNKSVEGRSDPMGLWAFLIKPMDLQYPIKVEGSVPYSRVPSHTESTEITDTVDTSSEESSAIQKEDIAETDTGPSGHRDAQGTLYPRVVYGGISITLDSPVVEADAPIKFGVSQISTGGPVYADLFKDGQWVHGASSWISPQGTGAFSIRPPSQGLFRLQVTNSALGSGKTVAVRHVYVMNGSEDRQQVVESILGRLQSRWDREWADHITIDLLRRSSLAELNRLSAFALSRLYKGHAPMPRLVSSRVEDDAELAQFKQTFQRAMMITIFSLGIAVALIIALIARQASRRQALLTAMIMDDEFDGTTQGKVENPKGASLSGTSRLQVLLQIGVLFVVIVSAFAAIALLVLTMSWGAPT